MGDNIYGYVQESLYELPISCFEFEKHDIYFGEHRELVTLRGSLSRPFRFRLHRLHRMILKCCGVASRTMRYDLGLNDRCDPNKGWFLQFQQEFEVWDFEDRGRFL